MIKIAPSILSANFADLRSEIDKVTVAGADLLHIDIMDGHFVPNLTFGAPVVSCLRETTVLPFDVHLMVDDPERFIEPFVKAGADIITVHVEATRHIHRLIQKIHEAGLKAGVALNPATSLAAVEEVLGLADIVLLMSVNPGFGGQKYIPAVTDKLVRLKKMIDARLLPTLIEVDGGITALTARQAESAGADILVAGSAVYGAADMDAAINAIKGLD